LAGRGRAPTSERRVGPRATREAARRFLADGDLARRGGESSTSRSPPVCSRISHRLGRLLRSGLLALDDDPSETIDNEIKSTTLLQLALDALEQAAASDTVATEARRQISLARARVKDALDSHRQAEQQRDAAQHHELAARCAELGPVASCGR
jgi:hypothetical protein